MNTLVSYCTRKNTDCLGRVWQLYHWTASAWTVQVLYFFEFPLTSDCPHSERDTHRPCETASDKVHWKYTVLYLLNYWCNIIIAFVGSLLWPYTVVMWPACLSVSYSDLDYNESWQFHVMVLVWCQYHYQQMFSMSIFCRELHVSCMKDTRSQLSHKMNHTRHASIMSTQTC